MTMPFYASAEQVMRDRSEYARKGIARGRSVVVLRYVDGVLFVAENPSSTLHKVSEIYDRIGFAAVGRYSEYENLRTAGVRFADSRGYSYDRRDVAGRALANAYAQALGAIFTEQQHKPYEVEICVAEVGDTADSDQLFLLTYDGSIRDEPNFVVMGGQTEPISASLRDAYRADLPLGEAVTLAVRALGTVGGENGQQRQLNGGQLEVAVLDRRRPTRKFRRVVGSALAALLPGPAPEPGSEPASEGGGPSAEGSTEPSALAPQPSPQASSEGDHSQGGAADGDSPAAGPSGEGSSGDDRAP